jgi:hypothetical protein
MDNVWFIASIWIVGLALVVALFTVRIVTIFYAVKVISERYSPREEVGTADRAKAKGDGSSDKQIA